MITRSESKSMKIAIQGGSRFGYKIQTQWIKRRGHQELYGRIMDLSPAVDISFNLPTQRSVQLKEFAVVSKLMNTRII